MSEKIKFQIEELDYQEDAVNSVIDLLKGVDRHAVSSIYSTKRNELVGMNSHPEANVRFNAGTRLVQNLQAVQYRNGLFKDNDIVGNIPQFTIEMETGTGKTFVYLETILRLWSEFGGQFKKFIIVVPSTAILMGVKKSIETFADFFKPKYNNIDISEHFFVFGKDVSPETVTSKLIESTDLSIMLITNASFNKEGNRLRKESENGVVVWNDIKDIAPIVIIDEPQKLDGDGKKKTASMKALEELNPSMILRYSATHKNLYNPVFKLDSYDAYKKHLVKGIKVTTVHSLTPKDFPYIRYVGFTSKLQARIEIFTKTQGKNIRCQKFDVDNNASLEELSGGLPQYHNWYIAAQPRKKEELQISKADGEILYIQEGKSNDEVDHSVAVEKQMEIAIRAHIQKQADILASGKKIKVLTLFFVDSVAKVRGDNDDGRGEYLRIFDRVFENIRSQPNLIESAILSEYPKEFASILFNNPVLLEHSENIIKEFVNVMQDKGSKKIEIANGDEKPFRNDVQKYVTEGEFGKMYAKLQMILQKRSVYRYELNKDEFIQATATEIDRQLKKKNDFIKFEVTKADVDFNDSRKMMMANAQKQVEDSTNHSVEYEERPLFELANVIMMHTMLPRLAIIKIINKLSYDSRRKLNNQDYLEEAISVINKQLIEAKSKNFLTAELIEGVGALEKDIFEVDKIINEDEIRYLFTPNPIHRRAMNLKYKFDSEGELKFAKALDIDPNVLLYTKLKKGGFIIETPAGSYSPDWAIVYQKTGNELAMYFIAETKWDKDVGDLSDDEKIKIKCATKHFEAVNNSVNDTVKYAWVNAYKDSTMEQSFPQVFIDDEYCDTLAE